MSRCDSVFLAVVLPFLNAAWLDAFSLPVWAFSVPDDVLLKEVKVLVQLHLSWRVALLTHGLLLVLSSLSIVRAGRTESLVVRPYAARSLAVSLP